MGYFSDRVVSFNKLVIAAAVAYAGAVGLAHAGTPSINREFIACTENGGSMVECGNQAHDKEVALAGKAHVAQNKITFADRVHQQLQHALEAQTLKANLSLPERIDSTTVDMMQKIDGLKITYVYELSTTTIADAASFKARLNDKVCADGIGKLIELGVTYAFEYWHDGDLLDTVNITSCPR